jgi:uracil-DNA glycosylase family 4
VGESVGFDVKDNIIQNSVPTRNGARAKRVPKQLSPQERGCDSCSLKETWPGLHTPRMGLNGPVDADILVMGEGPGQTEDQQGRPFVGAAGALLRQILPMRQADRLAMSNICRCRPPNNRTPTAREIHSCSLYLENDITNGGFKFILSLGGAPLSYFLNEATITHIHGLKFPAQIGDKTVWVFPTVHPSFVLRTGGDRSPILPILKNDLNYFFKFLDKWPKPVIEKIDVNDVICAYTEDEARGYCEQIRRTGKPVGFDIETNDLRPNTVDGKIMSAAVSNGEITVAWPIHHPQAPNDWGLPLMLEMTRRLRWIAHNSGFELAWLREHARRNNINWESAKGFDDSMVAARLFQRRESCLNLGVLTRIYCGINIKKLSSINTAKIAETSLDQVLPYNGLDAWGSWRLFKQFEPRIDKANYQSIMETIDSVTEMQLMGLDLDPAAANDLHEEWNSRAQAAANHAKSVHEVKQFERERQLEFNIASTEHVSDALISFGGVDLPRTARSERERSMPIRVLGQQFIGGPGPLPHPIDTIQKADKQRYSTDSDTLGKLAADNALAHDVLEYRHAKKMVSTYIEPLLQAQSRFVDGRIHPVYSTVLTRTLRLSAEDPNCQNWPRRKDRELRRPVVPPGGCVWASADYGQLEARIYAMASRDRALCNSIINDEDIHSYWLNVVLKEFPPYVDRLATKVTPNQTEAQIYKGGRDIIKSDLVFASFFGTTARNVAERTGIPYNIAGDVLGMFWHRYRGAYEWLKTRRKSYLETGLTKNLCGVERYGIMTGNEPVNYPIQSTAARLVLESQNDMYKLYKQHGDPHLLPRINIHDDLTFALPDDDTLLTVYIEEISKILVKVRFSWQIVPLKVEWKIGVNWAELYDVYEYTGEYVH